MKILDGKEAAKALKTFPGARNNRHQGYGV